MGSRISRRSFSGFLFSAPAVHALTTVGVTAQPSDSRRIPLVTEEAKRAIERGLRFLADLQYDDGSFGRSNFARNVGVCALAGMAWLTQGSPPLRGRFGANSRRCVDYLVQNIRPDGFIVTPNVNDERPMYGHGFATMFLAEIYGQFKSAGLRKQLDTAVKLILSAQHETGGWRYQPRPQDADISVTACQLTALRAAKNAGFYVPAQAVQRAVAYIESCQNPDGGFAYQAGLGDSRFARSAAAVAAIYGAGVYDGKVISAALAYLQALKVETDEQYYYYGVFYAAQVMWQSGFSVWKEWFPAVRDQLISLQKEDGSWSDSIGPAYATAIALIVLQMENDYVPLFQK